MSIEQGPGKIERTMEEKILEFKNEFDRWQQQEPKIAARIKSELLSMAGVEEDELNADKLRESSEAARARIESALSGLAIRIYKQPSQPGDTERVLALLKIPVEELRAFGTVCGTVGNQAFSKKAIDFLRSRKVAFVIALGEKQKPVLLSAAIKLSERDAEKLSEMISDAHGSLRADVSSVRGWSVFESE